MKTKLSVVLASILAAVPAMAHHSFAAEFDSAKTISVKGAVTRVEWVNPHARFWVDVADESGKVTNWEFELGSPNSLMRAGWNRTSLKPGDMISVDGFPAKDGAKLANAKAVSLANGRKVFSGDSYNEENEKK
jgi:uncharacterized protein DUF6152